MPDPTPNPPLGTPTPTTTAPNIPLFGDKTLKAQLPNALTAARLLAAAAFAAVLTILPPTDDPNHRTLVITALILFAAAAATDALDGHLARKWNAISILGRVMDPLADKLLIIAAFIILPAVPGSGCEPWMALVIVARELLITSIRGVCESQGIDFSASTAGKLKMIAQSIAVPAILLVLAIDPGATHALNIRINTTIAYATTLITAYSAVPYITRAIAGLKANT